jgi:hypothetical protein
VAAPWQHGQQFQRITASGFTREDDYRDANHQFQGSVTHDMIAPLRQELAPEWTRKGRRATKSEKKKSEA